MKQDLPKQEKYIKDFDKWNERKKKINSSKRNLPIFKEKEIWWISIGINIGSEEDGKGKDFTRPVLIIKKFNQQLFLGIPMSTIVKTNKYYLVVKTKKGHVSLLISQIRAFSSNRLLKTTEKIDNRDFQKIIRNVKRNLFLPSPRPS